MAKQNHGGYQLSGWKEMLSLHIRKQKEQLSGCTYEKSIDCQRKYYLSARRVINIGASALGATLRRFVLRASTLEDSVLDASALGARHSVHFHRCTHLLCSTLGTRYSVLGASALDARCSAFDTSALDARCSALGARCLALGARHWVLNAGCSTLRRSVLDASALDAFTFSARHSALNARTSMLRRSSLQRSTLGAWCIDATCARTSTFDALRSMLGACEGPTIRLCGVSGPRARRIHLSGQDILWLVCGVPNPHPLPEGKEGGWWAFALLGAFHIASAPPSSTATPPVRRLLSRSPSSQLTAGQRTGVITSRDAEAQLRICVDVLPTWLRYDSEQDENAIQMAGDDVDIPEELRKMVDEDTVEEEEKDSILGQIQNIQNMDMDTIKEKAQATFSEMKEAAEQKCTSEQDENAIQMAGDDVDIPEELRKMVDEDTVEEEEKDSILGQIQNIQNMDMDTIKEKAQATFSEMKEAAEQKCTVM
ncbi:UNVERIFIED_CONTAM: hypothetical protein FKN15_069071 [Acipenser sinensis]